MLLCGQTVSAQAVLLSADFEDAAFPPAGWTVLDRDGDTHTWVRYTGGGITHFNPSTASAVSFMGEPGTSTIYGEQDNWLVTPAITVTNNQMEFSFEFAAQSIFKQEPVEILVSETDLRPESFVSVDTRTAKAEEDWDEADGEKVITKQTYVKSLADYVGKTIYIAVRHNATGTYALSTDNFKVVNNNGPKRITGISVTAGEKGALEANLSWDTPSQTGTFEAITDIDILIYRDGALIATVKGNPGQRDTYTDTGITAGKHVYNLEPRTSEGTGQRSSSIAVTVGPDIPDCVDDVIALASAGKVVVKWKAPSQGANKGYIDPAALTYTITRTAEGEAEKTVSGITATEWTDEAPVVGKVATYVVKAVNGAGTSAYDYLASAVATAPGTDDMGVAITDDFKNYSEKLPIDLYSEYSVSQSMYYPADFNLATGTISQVIYKLRKGNDAEVTLPVAVYMHETTATDLSAGWDKSALNDDAKVFEGNISYSLGSHDVAITLDKPYSYKGGNLVITFVKTGKPNGSMLDQFFQSDLKGAVRSYTGSTYSAVDINNLPTFSSYSEKKLTRMPSTRFVIDAKGVTPLSGKVTDITGKPVAGAKIQIYGFDGLETVTGTDGTYAFSYVPVSAGLMIVTRPGYSDKTQMLRLAEGTAAVCDITLDQLQHYALSGKVVATDTGLDADGAIVTLSGYDEVTVTADTDGTWTIDPVYSGKDYTLTVQYPLYEPYTVTVNNTADTDLGTISLGRALIPPFAVAATVATDGSAVSLSWQNPLDRDVNTGWYNLSPSEDISGFGGDASYYSPDNFNVGHLYKTADIEAKKLAGTAVSGVKVYIKATEGTFIAKVWRGSKTDNIVVAEQQIPAAAISADGAWAEVEFDAPAEIHAGYDYIVGVQALNASSMPFGYADDYISGVTGLKWTDVPGKYTYDVYDSWQIAADFEVPGTGGVTPRPNADAPACEYKVYRREAADADWTAVTAAPVRELALTDEGWASLLPGTYTYGVTAVYRGAESSKALSDAISRSADTDAGVVEFIEPVRQAEMRDKVNVKVRITNFGEKPLTAIPVAVTLNGGEPVTATCDGPVAKGESAVVDLGEITITEGVHTLRAYTALAGDDTPANDACEMLLSNLANIRLNGYRWNAYGNAGFMTIESNNAEGAVLRRELTTSDALISSGEYYDGKVYAYASTWYGQPRAFVIVDPATWTIEKQLENEDDYMLDMTYSYPAKTMYGLRPDGEEVHLATIDTETGMATPVVRIDRHLMTLAADTRGKLYGIADDGIFYTLDAATGATTAVGTTGIAGTVKYLQSMAWDHNSGRLFWAAEGDIAGGDLHEVDPATGAATRLGSVLFNHTEPSEIVALHTAYTYDGISDATSAEGALTIVVESDATVCITAAAAAELRVYNAAGILVASETVGAGASRVSLDLPGGVYLFSLADAAGHTATAKAAVK